MTDEAKKVLVAEDDNFLMKVYEVKLNKEGFNLIMARDGEEAVKLIKSEKPDIILLDLVMPKKNGFEVLTEVKADPETKNIPILILSNLGQVEDIKKGLDAGADDYIIKADVSIEEIVEKIRKKLKARSSLTIASPDQKTEEPKPPMQESPATPTPEMPQVETKEAGIEDKGQLPANDEIKPSNDQKPGEQVISEPAQVIPSVEKSEPAGIACQNCKEIISAGAKFCPNCGYKINKI